MVDYNTNARKQAVEPAWAGEPRVLPRGKLRKASISRGGTLEVHPPAKNLVDPVNGSVIELQRR